MNNRPATDSVDKNSALIEAARTGQVERCAELLGAGAGTDINAQTAGGSTPLLLAAQNGHFAVVRMLLAQGASQQITNSKGGFPAYVAAQYGRTECLRLLLDKGENVNRGCPTDHATAVYIAAYYGQMDCVKLLLERGANPLLKCTDGEDAIFTAKQHKHAEIVTVLEAAASKFKTDTSKKEAPASKANTHAGKTPLTTAIQNRQYNLALDLIKHGVEDISDVDLYNLNNTARASDNAATFIELLTTLEAAHVSNDQIKRLLPSTFETFNTAGLKNIKDVIYTQILAEKDKAKRDELIKSAQDKNTWRGHILYLQRGYKQCDPNKGVLGKLAAFQANQQQLNVDLFYAAESGDDKEVEKLLARGADANYVHKKADYDRVTPLYIAAQNNHEKVIKLLIANGGNVNSKSYNHGKTTPLCMATQQGHINIARYLLEHNADVNAEKDNGSTALHVAAHNRKTEILALLLQYRPDVNKKNHDGITPLHRAAAAGDIYSIKLLLQHNADPLIASDEYGSPIDAAKRKGHNEVVEMLEQHIKQHAKPTAKTESPVVRELNQQAVTASAQTIADAAPKTAPVYPNLKELLAKSPAIIASTQVQTQRLDHAAAAAFYDQVLPSSLPRELTLDPAIIADPGGYFDNIIKHAGKLKTIDLTVKESPVATVESLLTFPAPADSLISFPEPVELLTLPSVDDYIFNIDAVTAKALPQPLTPIQLSQVVDTQEPVTTKSWLDELYALPPTPTHLIQHSIFMEKREEAAVVVDKRKEKKEEKRQALLQ